MEQESEGFQPKTIEPVTEDTPQPERPERVVIESEQQGPVQEVEDTDDKPLAIIGTPPIVDELDIMILYSSNIDDVKNKVAVVDSYIRHLMDKQDIKATVGEYKRVFNELKEDLNINPETTGMSQISLMFYYLRGKMDI